MVRAFSLVAVLASAPMISACSLFLDFSDEAGVHDAAIDGPYTHDQCAYKEPNDTLDSAAAVGPGDTGPAAICAVDKDAAVAEDDDYYKITVAAGTTKVTLTLTNSDQGGDLDLILFDTTGSTLGQSRGFTNMETLVCPGVSPACPALAAGDYVFEILPGKPGNLNNYTFDVKYE